MTIKVLVVDDAVVIRRILVDMIDAEPDLEVVGTASDGRIALAKIEALRPDVVTLDVEMPELDGLGTLVELRRTDRTTPVIMFSTLTARGAVTTLDALAAGATDYVTKPSNVGRTGDAIARIAGELLPRIRALTTRREPSGTAPIALRRPGRARRIRAVVVGSSTGGPVALETMLSSLEPLPVPMLITQHMPPVFTGLLAERLDKRCATTVVEAEHGMPLRDGHAYVAPGGRHMAVGTGPVLVLHDQPPVNFCRPAVDVTLQSVVDHFGGDVLGVVLTGMGQDGLEGCRALVDAGGEVIAQDEATSVVWGMPGAVARDGLASAVLPIEQIGPTVARRLATTMEGAHR